MVSKAEVVGFINSRIVYKYNYNLLILQNLVVIAEVVI